MYSVHGPRSAQQPNASRPLRQRSGAAGARLAAAVLVVWTLFAGAGLLWGPAGGLSEVSAAGAQETATPTPTAGTIVGIVWQDLNADSVRDSGEPPLPGVTLRVYTLDGLLLVSTASAADGSYRFATLSPGFYRLVAEQPLGYEFTTRASYDVRVSANTTLELNFGVLFIPTPTPTATPIPELDITNAETLTCGSITLANTHAGAANVRRYGCNAGWNESGPELAYRLSLTQNQLLSAKLQTPAADLDLFLLTSQDPNSCLASGDNYLTYQIEPGTYYLVVDGYEGAAGEFTLRLTCPAETQATATPTPTPSPTPTATITPTPGPTNTPTPKPQLRHRYLPLILMRYTLVIPDSVTLVLQQDRDGYSGSVDTFLSAWEPEIPQGDGETLTIRYNRQTEIKTHMAPLLRFDLALLPAEARIVTATLRLYLTGPETEGLVADVHQVLRPWDEATATWQYPQTGAPWGIPGAQETITDHAAAVIDSQWVKTVDQWCEFDVKSLVANWITAPGQNYGILLLVKERPEQLNIALDFASSEYTDPALHPQLVIDYWIPG